MTKRVVTCTIIFDDEDRTDFPIHILIPDPQVPDGFMVMQAELLHPIEYCNSFDTAKYQADHQIDQKRMQKFFAKA